MTVLSIDFETASRIDLKKAGAARYARDPSTQVLCMAYAFDDEPVEVWAPGVPFPWRVAQHVADRLTVRGWNVGFEYEIWSHVLQRVVNVQRLAASMLDDTMARAAYWGLPLSLDDAGLAIGARYHKDKDGHRLMMRMSRPRKVHADGTCSWWHEDDPERYERLMEYCAQDVRVEREIASRLPPLPEIEQKTWLADFFMNQAGARLDRELIEKLQAVADAETKRLDDEVQALTHGIVKSTRQTAALLAVARGAGYPEDNLQKATMESWRAQATAGYARDLIDLRIEASRSSAAKLKSMLATMDPEDDRARGLTQYYGASRTGRWAGRLIQPQNFPRGTVKRINKAIDAVLAGADPETLNALFEDTPMGVVASSLRGCIVAPPDQWVVACDLAQIEARVVAWLAGQDDLLDVFARDEDVYTYQAGKQGSSNRQYGKVIVLGCGYGMGASKFKDTAAGYGLDLTDEEAYDAVDGYRQSNPKIVELWYRCGDAAMEIARGGAKYVGVRNIAFRRRGGTMLIELPSGRELVYRGIGIETDPLTGRDGVTYMGVDQTTRKWTRIRTYGGKLVENITQAVARDVMRDALLQPVSGFEPVLSVHDELIGYSEPRRDPQGVLDRLVATMSTSPWWADGLPVGAEGWFGPRYKKG